MTSIDPVRFRTVLGHVPTSVVVVTGLTADGEPGGLTIGSFTSVSLDPPLIGFLPGFGSKSWPEIAAGGSFCVNVLGADQGELCWRFAKDTAGRFDAVDWTEAPSGSPVLPGVIAWIDCSIEHVYEMGDHWFVLGRVEELHAEPEVADAMIFFKGKVCGVTPQ